MNEIFCKNLQALTEATPELAVKLGTQNCAEFQAVRIPIASGGMTLEVQQGDRTILLHSKYDPLREATRLVEAKGIKEGDFVVVFGFGLGYHVSELLKAVGDSGQVIVFEINLPLFTEVMKYLPLEPLLVDPRFQLILETDIAAASAALVKLLAAIQNYNGHLLIHGPSLEVTPEGAGAIKQVLLEWQVKQNTLARFGGTLKENFDCNRTWVNDLPNVTQLFSRFPKVPAMLVAAGPSLDQSLEEISQAQENCLIVTVGTALKPLLAAGIRPDLVVITEAHPVVLQQIEGIHTSAPLIAFPTVSPDVLNTYPGPRIMAFQSGIDEVEKIAVSMSQELIDSGGSVSTAALDIMIRMGCNPILFAGLDLGFIEGRTHAAGTMHSELRINDGYRLLNVTSNNNQTIKATPGLSIFRKWVEARIKKAGGRTKFYNLSAVGAQIEGAPLITWAEAKKKLLADQTETKEQLKNICTL